MAMNSGGDPSDGAASMVDWELAIGIGSKIAGLGPVISRSAADTVVDELRRDADASTGYVADFTGLEAPRQTAPILVVDRPGWIRANTQAFSTLLTPVVDRMAERQQDASALAVSVGSKVSAVEVGGLLGFLSSRVLGQFDPFHDPHGRLLLVAPNVVNVERELDVDPTDFRLWVCLHEETHRVQFTANPWLREHLFAQVKELSGTMDPGKLLERGVKQVGDAIKGDGSILDAVTTPEQRVIVDRVTGMMSLLEGHADVVMDGVGPSVIPSVAKIRRTFDKRRQGVGTLDRILRRLMGIDAKMAQYRDGATFVRAVVDKVGMAQFNAVFAGPEQLPSKDEIANPDAWISRVL